MYLSTCSLFPPEIRSRALVVVVDGVVVVWTSRMCRLRSAAYVRMYVCMSYLYLCTYVCMYVCRIYIYVRMYVCMYVCRIYIYVCIYIR